MCVKYLGGRSSIYHHNPLTWGGYFPTDAHARSGALPCMSAAAVGAGELTDGFILEQSEPVPGAISASSVLFYCIVRRCTGIIEQLTAISAHE
jgi:hypothetical protein